MFHKFNFLSCFELFVFPYHLAMFTLHFLRCFFGEFSIHRVIFFWAPLYPYIIIFIILCPISCFAPLSSILFIHLYLSLNLNTFHGEVNRYIKVSIVKFSLLSLSLYFFWSHSFIIFSSHLYSVTYSLSSSAPLSSDSMFIFAQQSFAPGLGFVVVISLDEVAIRWILISELALLLLTVPEQRKWLKRKAGAIHFTDPWLLITCSVS